MRFRRADGAVDRWFRGVVLLVDRSGAGHELGGAAALVWVVLDQPGTVPEIEARLAELIPAGGPAPTDLIEDAVELLLADDLVVSSTES